MINQTVISQAMKTTSAHCSDFHIFKTMIPVATQLAVGCGELVK